MTCLSELAKYYAIKQHQGQKRKNGEDYVIHPLAVGYLVEHYKKSHNLEVLKAAAYLHDTLEDTRTTFYDLVALFGVEVASLVMELTTNENMVKEIGKAKYLAFKLSFMTSWALVIKLCDRLHNISDLFDVDEDFKNRYLAETNYIIDYIEQNRFLTNTHQEIIKDIKLILKKVENKSLILVKNF